MHHTNEVTLVITKAITFFRWSQPRDFISFLFIAAAFCVLAGSLGAPALLQANGTRKTSNGQPSPAATCRGSLGERTAPLDPFVFLSDTLVHWLYHIQDSSGHGLFLFDACFGLALVSVSRTRYRWAVLASLKVSTLAFSNSPKTQFTSAVVCKLYRAYLISPLILTLRKPEAVLQQTEHRIVPSAREGIDG